ncbi:MAG: acyl-CoA carboxylase subunit beta [Lachnospiraceae bacterium]
MNATQVLNENRLLLYSGGGVGKIEEQHRKGKMTARERLEYFFDKGTFLELNAYMEHNTTDFGLESKKAYGDGVITGFGLVKGRKVFAYAQDFTFLGGSLGETHAEKISRLLDKAMEAKCPIVGLYDSGGARIQEGVRSLAGFGKIFYRHTKASGMIPQIAAIMGPCAGGSVYSPALMDFIFMVENTSQMFITGPQVIATVTGEMISVQQLGGADTHASISGVAHAKAKNEKECLDQIKTLLSYLPDSASCLPEKNFSTQNIHQYCKELDSIMPDSPKKAYDIYQLIRLIVDDGEFFEIQSAYAQSIITGFSRIDGYPVGIIANNPKVLAGCLDIKSSGKAARFIRTCDMFSIPIVTLVDTPGFLPGSDQEYNGIIRHGSAVLFAYSESTVPKVTVITRKAYGGAYIAMCSRELGADAVYAWPTAEIAVMGPEGAANIIFKNEIAAAENPDYVHKEKVTEYKQKFANPYTSASSGYVDDVILPGETRERIILTFMMMRKKSTGHTRKHGNIPL